MLAVASFAVYLLFAMLIAAAFGTSVMAFSLRRRFPDVWREWGHPVQWLWLTPAKPGHHVFGFLESRAYRATGDTGFVRLCEVLRTGWYVVLALFPVAMVLQFIAFTSE